MTEVEKINTENALKITNEWLSALIKYEAPYFGSGDMEAIKMALEKQISMKPMENIIGFYCPECKRFIETVHNYCGFCGQKIEWSEEDEID